jgi:hypothetical protein
VERKESSHGDAPRCKNEKQKAADVILGCDVKISVACVFPGTFPGSCDNNDDPPL